MHTQERISIMLALETMDRIEPDVIQRIADLPREHQRDALVSMCHRLEALVEALVEEERQEAHDAGFSAGLRELD